MEYSNRHHVSLPLARLVSDPEESHHHDYPSCTTCTYRLAAFAAKRMATGAWRRGRGQIWHRRTGAGAGNVGRERGLRVPRVIAPHTFQDHGVRRLAQGLARRRGNSSYAISAPRETDARVRTPAVVAPGYFLRHTGRAGAGFWPAQTWTWSELSFPNFPETRVDPGLRGRWETRDGGLDGCRAFVGLVSRSLFLSSSYSLVPNSGEEERKGTEFCSNFPFLI